MQLILGVFASILSSQHPNQCFFRSTRDTKPRNSYALLMTNNLKLITVSMTSILTATGCATTHSSGASHVELKQSNGNYTLLKDGEPYTILGVGGTTQLDTLAKYGGNTVRTWDAEGIGPMLDEAEEHGISVVAGIWLEHQRHGLDYSVPHQREEELERVRLLVNEHKDHPALLAWGVGNELELGGDFDIALQQINDAAAIIKELDPNHPRMAVIAEIGDDKARRIQDECPDIDFIGINSYGGMGSLTPRLKAQDYTGAFAITEFGPIGHWETGNSPWGAPYEQSSSAKAKFIKANYERTIEANLGEQCLGSFAFLWGNKQEKTETWYGLILPTGETTESVDVLSTLWTGEEPENKAPRVSEIDLGSKDAGNLQAGQKIRVRVVCNDPDNDPLEVEWRIIPESTAVSMGGDHESGIQSMKIDIKPLGTKRAEITLPSKPGEYRIFATVRDGHKHGGTVNLPILIKGNAAE